MLFYPIEVRQTNGWIEIGWIAGPLREALAIVQEVTDECMDGFQHYRLGKPKEGIGIAEDWICPICGYNHIIRWHKDNIYSCVECRYSEVFPC